MGILDTNYEDNTYIMENPTLSFDDNGNPINYIYHISVGALYGESYTDLPSYAAIKNSINMHLPVLSKLNPISPFDNPNPLSCNMFGIHAINKPMKFNSLKIITPIDSYPYLKNNDGEVYSSDGLLSGYAINGMSKDLLDISISGESIPFITLNDDVYTNCEVKRLLYSESGEYGSYQLIPTYINMPISGDNTMLTTVYTKEMKATSECTFYDASISEGAISYSVTTIDSVTKESYVLINMSTSSGIEPTYVSLETIGNDGDIKTYDDTTGKLIFYDDSAGSNITELTPYQYIPVTTSSYELSLSDGYGSDTIVNLDNNITYPNNITLSIPDSDDDIHTLTIDTSTLSESDFSKISVSLYRTYASSHVDSTEQYWNNINTTLTNITGSDMCLIDYYNGSKYVYGEKILIISSLDLYEHLINTTKTLQYVIKSFKIGYNLYQLINNYTDYITISNNTTGANNSDYPGNKKAIYCVLGGCNDMSKLSHIKYDISQVGTGDATVTLYIGETTTGRVIYDGNTYKFSISNKKYCKLQEHTITKSVSTINGKYIVNVYDQNVNCGGVSDTSQHVIMVTDETGIMPMGYRFSNFTLSTEEDILEYPEYGTNKILTLFDLSSEYDNQIECNNSLLVPLDGKQLSYVYNVDPIYESVFLIGKYTQQDGTKYITYSPKLDITIPKIIALNSSSTIISVSTNKVVVTGTNNWVDDDTSCWYLKNYVFTLKQIVSESEEYTYSSVDASYQEVTDDSGEFICNGFVFELTQPIEKLKTYKWEITDITNLTISNLSNN